MEAILSVFAALVPSIGLRRIRMVPGDTRPGLVDDDARTVGDNAP